MKNTRKRPLKSFKIRMRCAYFTGLTIFFAYAKFMILVGVFYPKYAIRQRLRWEAKQIS